MFRIEDIVVNTLIKKCNQIFFENNYQSRMNSPIITTENELLGQQIIDFSNKLELDELFNYVKDFVKYVILVLLIHLIRVVDYGY